MLTVETAAGCVTVRRRVDRWKISAYFASTDTISDKKDNHGGRTDHGQQLRPQDADGTYHPALKLLTAHTRVDSFNVSEHDHDLSDIRYRFRYGFRCSDASSDAGTARGARGRRRALSGGLSQAGAPGQKPAQRADGVLNAGPTGDDGLRK